MPTSEKIPLATTKKDLFCTYCADAVSWAATLGVLYSELHKFTQLYEQYHLDPVESTIILMGVIISTMLLWGAIKEGTIRASNAATRIYKSLAPQTEDHLST